MQTKVITTSFKAARPQKTVALVTTAYWAWIGIIMPSEFTVIRPGCLSWQLLSYRCVYLSLFEFLQSLGRIIYVTYAVYITE